MNEDTLLSLLSRHTSQLIEHFDEKKSIKQRDELAQRLAAATWASLIFLLRQSLANKKTLVLRDVGSFREDKGEVLFEPAASLVQAGGLGLPAGEAYEEQASRALFYLHEGAEILKCIPYDIEARRTESAGQTQATGAATAGQPSATRATAKERLAHFFAHWGADAPNTLSGRVRMAANKLLSQAGRLEKVSATEGTAETKSAVDSNRAGASAWPEESVFEFDAGGEDEAESAGGEAAAESE